MKSKLIISASIMCADLLHLERDLQELQHAQVEYNHLDVMDGHFVDNITLGFDCCRLLAQFPTPRDIHLLVQNPENHVEKLLLKEGDIFQYHFESNADIRRIAEKVHAYGARMGVVLNPETEIQKLEPWLDCIDVVTLMMIKPGFAGRPMEAGMLEKIAYVRRYLDDAGYMQTIIEVDGNVNVKNVPEMYRNGAAMVVAGTSSIFRQDITITEGVEKLRNCVLA